MAKSMSIEDLKKVSAAFGAAKKVIDDAITARQKPKPTTTKK